MKRTWLEPLPAEGDKMNKILHFVRRALLLSSVQEVKISSRGVEVVREMTDEQDDVVPPGSDDVDLGFLLENVEVVAYPFDPSEYGHVTLARAMQHVRDKNKEVHAVVLPGLELPLAWLGIEDTRDNAPHSIYGHRAMVVPPMLTNERVVVLGGPVASMFLTDVDFAIAIDLGV